MFGTSPTTEVVRSLEVAVKLRTVREDPRFAEQCRELKLDIRRLDEVLLGATFAVARRPDYFPRIPETDLRVIVTGKFRELPPLLIFYRLARADEYVDLVGIERWSADPDDPVA